MSGDIYADGTPEKDAVAEFWNLVDYTPKPDWFNI